MKAVKLAGIRLVNYIMDGINWKDHKDIVLDFWVAFKCRESGYVSKQFDSMFTVEELPVEAQNAYETWFNSFNFQTTEDKDWIEFVNGTLNIFYHTSDPMMVDEDEWYVDLMKSEVEAREIAETQLYHGNPNINSFWKLDTNSKPEEVGGRRNGYLFTQPLEKIMPQDTRTYFWGVVFQCPDTIKLFYDDAGTRRSKCINWAANCKHMTLVRIASDGRFIIDPVFVEGKAWKGDRYVPNGDVIKTPLTGGALVKYIKQNFQMMYGIWDEIDEEIKSDRENTNQRKNAINTFNDEEVKVSKVIDNVPEFIENGNVSEFRRDRNKQIRQAIRDKNKLRDREIKKKIRELEKQKTKENTRKGDKLNAFKH
jgi:hypothetical protein